METEALVEILARLNGNRHLMTLLLRTSSEIRWDRASMDEEERA